MNMAAISEPNTMIPATAATQKMRPRRREVVQGIPREPLTEEEPDRGRDRDDFEPIATFPCSGPEAKLIETTRAPTSYRRRIPPRLSTGSLVSFTWLGTKDHEHEAAAGERKGDEEHRAPPEVFEQGARDQRAQGGDRAPDRRPQRDRRGTSLARPQRGDQRERRRIRRARGEPTQDPSHDNTLVRRAQAASNRPAPKATRRGRASTCVRSGHPRAPSYNTDTARPNEYPTATRSREVCDTSNALPMSGRRRWRQRVQVATAATRMKGAEDQPRAREPGGRRWAVVCRRPRLCPPASFRPGAESRACFDGFGAGAHAQLARCPEWPGSSRRCGTRSAPRRSLRSSGASAGTGHSHLGGGQWGCRQAHRDRRGVRHALDLAEPFRQHPRVGLPGEDAVTSCSSIRVVFTSPRSRAALRWRAWRRRSGSARRR